CGESRRTNGHSLSSSGQGGQGRRGLASIRRLRQYRGANARLRPECHARAKARDQGRPVTLDEKVEEASIESMIASDPPGYLPLRSGAPARPGDETEPDAASVRRLTREIWEREGRQSGRDEEYRQRAIQLLRRRAYPGQPT